MATKKKGRPTKAEQERRARAEQLQKERKQRQQRWSVLLFALAIFLFALALVEGQSVWLWMHNVLFGLFGIFAYGVGPLVFLLALMTAYEKTVNKTRTLFAVLLILSFCGTFLIFGKVDVFGVDFFDKVKNLYLSGVAKQGGGVISAVFGWTLLALFGHPGADITIILLLFVFFMVLTGKSLIDLIEAIRKPINAKREQVKQEMELLAEMEEQQEQVQPAAAEQPTVPEKNRPKIDIPLNAASNSKIDIPLEPKSDIDIPLGPTAQPKAAEEDLIDIPFDAKDTEPEDSASDDGPLFLAQRGNVSKKPEAEVVLSIFEEAEREKREKEEIFAQFPQQEAKTEPAVDSETERLIQRAADNYKEKEPVAKPVAERNEAAKEYRAPSVSLLERDSRQAEGDVSAELRANADFLVKTLESFGVQTKVIDIARGPTVTRYELQPSTGVRLNRITNLADDIALNLATAGVRIEAPIPNKAAVGIEVPNKQKRMVRLRSIVESDEFRNAESPLTVALGRDISGKVMVTDVAKMPHLLIAGTTGSGKSRCLHSMILSLIYKSPPEDLRFVLIDPKMVEFGIYNGIPHMLIPVVTDARKASGALGWAVGEMLKRYKLFSEYGVRDITSYNKMVERGEYQLELDDEGNELEGPEKLPRIVVIIDELADLMMASPREVEDSICRLAQMARAAGLHLIIATQRPSVDVITGVIKANISSRIALSVSSQIDSRTIIDSAGAEKLIGNGDMLFLPLDLPKPVRIQGCFVSDEEIDKVIKDLKKNAVIEYNEQVLEEIERQAAKEKSQGGAGSAAGGEDSDSMLDAAITTVVEAGQASTSLLQRRLKLGYARAARIMDEMEQMGIIGPSEGSKPRVVNLTMQQWQEMQINRDQRQ